jgi:transcriptional regulator with XRE-family HTH domain
MATGGEAMRSDQLEKVLGSRVRNARFSQKLTQAEVAERANVSLGALKHLESGSGATVYTLVKVLRALGHEDWLGTLEPETAGFNPLDLLSAREAELKGARPLRVRRPRADAQ